MRRFVRICFLVAAVAAGLSLLPIASAAASTATATCTKTTLLLPGATFSCTTPAVVCPPPAQGLNQCVSTAKAAASATVGIAVAAKATSTVVATLTPVEGDPFSQTAFLVASCTAQPLVVAGGCTAQTGQGLAGAAGDTGVVGTPGMVTFNGTGSCQWTGGPIAVLVRLTCTQQVEYSPFPI